MKIPKQEYTAEFKELAVKPVKAGQTAWIVVSGMARVVNGQQDLFVNTNESTYISAGHKHRLENPGLLDLVMIEVQSGEYLGEDDIVRFDDVYGRK